MSGSFWEDDFFPLGVLSPFNRAAVGIELGPSVATSTAVKTTRRAWIEFGLLEVTWVLYAPFSLWRRKLRNFLSEFLPRLLQEER